VKGQTEAASAPPEELDEVEPDEDPEVDPLVVPKRGPSGTLASELAPDVVEPEHAACPSTIAASSPPPTRTKSKLLM
jgi:hypothetical protein